MDKAVTATNTVTSRNVVPFTGGLLFVAYAFFWPVEYGHWLGTIVRSFRAAAGF
jgi:hypothetical protein